MALNRLPPDLPETYTSFLNRIAQVPDDFEIAHKALTWLIYCQRPLRLEELAIAIALDSEDAFLELDADKEIILEICGPFLRYDSGTKVVSIVHNSVSEFLRTLCLPDGRRNVFFIDHISGHAFLLKGCLTQLSLAWDGGEVASQLIPVNEDWSILEYASTAWMFHAKEAETELSSQGVVNSFLRDPYRRVFVKWSEFWEGRYDSPKVSNRTGIYYAALFGLREAFNILLRNGEETNIPTDFGNILLAAAFAGDSATLVYALEAGADVNARDENKRTALHFASRGHIDVVKLLLSAKSDTTMRDTDGISALEVATACQDEEIMNEIVSYDHRNSHGASEVAALDLATKISSVPSLQHDYDDHNSTDQSRERKLRLGKLHSDAIVREDADRLQRDWVQSASLGAYGPVGIVIVAVAFTIGLLLFCLVITVLGMEGICSI